MAERIGAERIAAERIVVERVVAVVAIAAMPLSFLGPGWLRLAVIGPFLMAGPGTALVLVIWRPRLRGRPRAWEGLSFSITLAVGTSLAATVLVATAMLYTGWWYPGVAVCLLAATTLALLAAARYRTRRDRSAIVSG